MLTNSDPTLVFTFLAIFVISSISFNFMVSTFFSRGESLPSCILALLTYRAGRGKSVKSLVNFGWEAALEVIGPSCSKQGQLQSYMGFHRTLCWRTCFDMQESGGLLYFFWLDFPHAAWEGMCVLSHPKPDKLMC